MIRKATEWDALVCLEMGKNYIEEVQDFVGLPYEDELAVGNMLNALHDPRQLFILSLDSKGNAAGMLWAFCGPMLPWSSASVAVDQIVYVRPEKRGTKHGLLLIKAYEEWANDLGAKEVRLSIASGIHEEKSGRLYEKLGYNRLGSQFRRRIQ